MSYIEISNLKKKYKKLTAVDDFSLNIEKGDILGIVGPNGAGKTTLISMLNTRLLPNSGNAKIAGFDLLKQGHDIRKIIGVVFQESVVDKEMSPFTSLNYQGMLYRIPKKTREKRISNLLKLIGLTDVKNKEVSKFSGGMKRRVEIARGLMSHPEILYLDEPTLGLDPLSRRKIWSYIKKLNQTHKMTIIITTNYMQEADELCNKIAIMNKGKLIVYNEINELKDSLKGDIIDLKAETKNIKSIFKKINWINSIEEYENNIRLYVQKGEHKILKVIDLLREKNIKLLSITLKKPSLDDVFIHYCGEEL